jgi:hypothetical protein
MRPILTKPVLVVPASAHAREGNPQIGTGPVSTLVRAIGEAVGAAAVFSPDDLAGLEAWYKADAITGLADADPVATWIDSSGNGNDATQGTGDNKPTYQTNELNGLPVVRFDGINDVLSASFTLDQPLSLFLVFMATNTAENEWIVDGTTLATMGVRIFNNQLIITADASLFSGTAYTQGTYKVATAIFDGASSRAALNGVGADGNAGTGTPSGIRLGGPTTALLEGDIVETIIYSRSLSASEREQVEDYLMDKYAL